jgi:hypothetical protein
MPFFRGAALGTILIVAIRVNPSKRGGIASEDVDVNGMTFLSG